MNLNCLNLHIRMRVGFCVPDEHLECSSSVDAVKPVKVDERIQLEDEVK
jgi:hypothetical protein